ncbi:MAG: hypothetical protein CSA62_08715 [Planctomycetota bacterium]|nr:MAG: hypothetical protein CSA62_08715 [Planctomycetota bacterium]
MGQIRGLWRDTWWLWLAFTAAFVLLTIYVMAVYLIFLPLIPIIFLYFAFGRYDEKGQRKENQHR